MAMLNAFHLVFELLAEFIDADPTATRLVHSHAAESQSVGCSLEHFCCCKVVVIADFHPRISVRARKSLLTH